VCASIAFPPGGGAGNGANTASDGTYTISGLAPGTYNVTANPTCYGSTPSNYAAQTLTGVTVSAGATALNENFALVQGGFISGTVTFASGGAAAGVCINAYSSGGENDSNATTAS